MVDLQTSDAGLAGLPARPNLQFVRADWSLFRTVEGLQQKAGVAKIKIGHWHDETAIAVTLINLGLARDDVLVETLRSPKQVEIRAKARGLKVPSEFIVSHPSGVSLVRSENARAPVPGRSEHRAVLFRGTRSLPRREATHD